MRENHHAERDDDNPNRVGAIALEGTQIHHAIISHKSEQLCCNCSNTGSAYRSTSYVLLSHSVNYFAEDISTLNWRPGLE